MVSKMQSVPVISFASYSLDHDKRNENGFQSLIDEVYNALTTVGFMCLKDFGIPTKMVSCFVFVRFTFFFLFTFIFLI